MSPNSPIADSADAIRALAAEVFILGYPMVLMDAVRRAHPIVDGQVLLLPDDPRGIAPGFDGEDSDVVMTSTWIDLEPGPVRFRVPEPRGRHFTLTLISADGEIIASYGPPSGHAGGGDFVIASERWAGELPEGATVARAPPGLVWAITRITARGAEDRSLARLQAARQRLTPLAAAAREEDATVRNLDAPSTSSVQRILEMTPEAYLHRLGVLLDRTKTDGEHRRHAAARAALETLRDSLQKAGAPADTKPCLVRGFEDGFAAIREAADPTSAEQPGEWRMLKPAGADTPLARAAQAFSALGAPATTDVLSLTCRADETGRALHGSERYRIHLPPGSSPPVDGFWSLNVSPGGRGDERTSLGSRDALAANRDGSLDLILQPMWPGAAHAGNWLSTPERAFTLTLKLYGPRPEALAGTWRMPRVERLGSRFARRGTNGSRASPNASDPPPEDPARRRGKSLSSGIKEMKPMRTLFATAGLALAASLWAAAAPAAAPPAAKPAATSPAADAKAELDPAALAALKRMSAYLGGLKGFELTSESTLDLVMEDGEKIQLNGVTTYKVRRPDGFVISTKWDRKEREFIYDGKQLTVYAPKLGYYAQVAAPATIRETFKLAYDKYGISTPLEDLFYWSETGDKALDPPDSGYYVGPSNIGGVEADHYAFRDGDLDWQIWIQKGDTPLPLKMVIIDRSDDERPQFDARLRWNTSPTLDPTIFAFKPDSNAKAIKMAGN